MSCDIEKGLLDGVRTLPFIVVAAKSLASGDVSDEESMECVVAHASGCLVKV